MRAAILRSGILLALVLGTSAATAQTELFFATGVDSTGWAQAQSNADGHVLIESPQYPRGLWLHLVDEAGDALAGVQVEYQGQPDSLVAIHCVDPASGVRETLVWTRPDGATLRLTLKPKKTGDAPIDWQINLSVESLLERVEKARLIGWEALAAFLREHWTGQTGRVAVRIKSSTIFTTFAVEVDRPEAVEALVAHMQQLHQTAGASLGENTTLIEVQVFRNLALLEDVIHLNPFFFEDAALATAVRRALGLAQGFSFAPEEAAALTRLGASDSDIHSLVGLGQLAALQRLFLSGNQISDLSPLAQLKNLEMLGLAENQIADLSPLTQLKNLWDLNLPFNQIADLSPLAQLKNLRRLYLSYNQIADLSPLADLKRLEWLGLAYNQMITDVPPLADLKNLKRLSLSGNQIADLAPLAQLKNLETLGLSYNQVDDVTPLADLKRLEELYLSYNQITDVTPLANLKNLKDLSLGTNQIDDLTSLANLKNLEELYLSYNQITDVTPLTRLTNLQRLGLDDNQIEDLSPLVANPGLGEGDRVYLENNPLSDQALNEHIPALKARGVRVSY